MKKAVLFLFFSISFYIVTAQDSVRITVTNQYKQQVAEAVISINNISYVSDKQGNIVIPSGISDSLTISKAGYQNQTFILNDVVKLKQLVLDKKFSWTDLLTPMFYILYGGIWLLLIIIFAETGLFIGFFFPGDSLLFVAGILSTPLVDSISLNTGNDFFNLLIISSRLYL